MRQVRKVVELFSVAGAGMRRWKDWVVCGARTGLVKGTEGRVASGRQQQNADEREEGDGGTKKRSPAGYGCAATANGQ